MEENSHDRYTVGIVCALPLEMAAMCAMLDGKEHAQLPPQRGDENEYTLGTIGKHEAALTCLGRYGTTGAAVAACNMVRSFQNIKIILLVGICGGVWSNDVSKDVRLGDVIVSRPDGNHGGIVRFGAGKEEKDGFKQIGTLNKPPAVMLNAINKLRYKMFTQNNMIQDVIEEMFGRHPGMRGSFSRPEPKEDRLFDADYEHSGGDNCSACDISKIVPRPDRPDRQVVQVWYGLLGSDDMVMKKAKRRDAIAREHNILGFEMEAAGVMDDFKCTAVRGVCDYSDSHKNKKWQGFAAVSAAACAKALLRQLSPRRVTIKTTTQTDTRRRSSVFQSISRSETFSPLSTTLAADNVTNAVSDESRLAKLKEYKDMLLDSNPLDDLETVGLPISGTCEWITTNQLFKSWRDDDVPSFLWISGRPGRGKTMISSFLIRHLQEVASAGTQVLYFFCSDFSETPSDADSVIKGLLWQVVDNACTTEDPARRECIHHHLEQHNRTLDYFSSPYALWRTLASVLSDPMIGPTLCLIDGLNECNKSRELIEKAERLLANDISRPDGRHMKFIFASQDTNALRNLSARSRCGHIDLDHAEQNEYLQQDMRTVVTKKLEQDLRHIPDFQNELEQEVGEALINRAEGSFVYLNYMIKDLREEHTRAGVRVKLDSIPNGLDNFLKRILIRIKDKTRLTTTTQILRLVAIAMRPLSRDEVAEAAKVLAFAAQNSGEQINTIYPDESVDDFINQCSPLLVERSGYVVFFHHSAKKFLREQALSDPELEDFHMDPAESHLKVARFCLKYIFRSPIKNQPARSEEDPVFQKWPCLQYAVTYWYEHARRAGFRSREIVEKSQADPVLHNSAQSMLQNARVRQNWWQTKIIVQSSRSTPLKELTLHEDESMSFRKLLEPEEKIQREMDNASPPPLHMFCRLGLLEWVRVLLEDTNGQISVKRALESLDSYGVQPLMWAAMEGHSDVAKFLLEKGAHPDVTCTLHRTTSWSNYKFYRSGRSYARQLSDQDARWTGDHTALYRAAFRGHTEMVRLLLKYGADPNFLGWADYNSVHAAAISGNKEILEMILDESTKSGDTGINMPLKVSGTTPLHFAVEREHVEIAKELIRNGATMSSTTWGTADPVLHCAVRSNTSTEMMTVLLDNCSEATIHERKDGDAAIHVATTQGDSSTIQLLLDYGANIDEKTFWNQDTSLHMAVKSSDAAIMEFLLNAGADIEARNKESKTALHIAAERGLEELVQTLIEYGANTRAEASGRSTPLHLVVTTGRVAPVADVFLDTIEVLLNNGAPVNAQNYKGQTPLDKAANRACDPIIQLLHSNDGRLHRPNWGVRRKYPQLFEPSQKKSSRSSRDSLHTIQSIGHDLKSTLPKRSSRTSKESLHTVQSIEIDSESGSEKSGKPTGADPQNALQENGYLTRNESADLFKVTSQSLVDEPADSLQETTEPVIKPSDSS